MFYVYELLDENGIVFYVGKGKGKRAYQHRCRAKAGDMTHRACKIRSIWARGADYSVSIVFKTDVEVDAFIEEKRRIALYGRDSLTNKTDGGDGPANPSQDVRDKIAASRRGRVASPETREKQRRAKLGIPRTDETKAKISAYQKGTKKPYASMHALKNLASGKMCFLGKKHTKETLKKMSLAKIGHPVSDETKRKISETKRKNKEAKNERDD